MALGVNRKGQHRYYKQFEVGDQPIIHRGPWQGHTCRIVEVEIDANPPQKQRGDLGRALCEVVDQRKPSQGALTRKWFGFGSLVDPKYSFWVGGNPRGGK